MEELIVAQNYKMLPITDGCIYQIMAAVLNAGLTKAKVCGNCDEESKDCKLCSRCRIIYYCSKKCQKEAFTFHKDSCKNVKKSYDKMKQLEEPLHNCYGEDLFETSVGHFWGLLGPRDYCRARFAYAKVLIQAGIDEDNVYAYEDGLTNYLELLRLSHSDNQGIRSYVPFVLLVLNRLEDCYGFIKWWATIDPHGMYDWGDAPDISEGEWAYLSNQNIYEDLLADRRVSKADDVASAHILALVLMKILLIKKVEKKLTKTRMAFLMGTDERYGKDSPVMKIANNFPVIDLILSYVKFNSGLPEQEKLLEKYCKILDEMNHRILKAVAHPEPLMSQRPPTGFSQNSTAEAYHVLSCGLFAFGKTGADRKIKQMYGSEPVYDYRMNRNDYIMF